MYQAILLKLSNSSLIVEVWSFIIYLWLSIIPLQRQNRTKYRLLIVPSIINEQRKLLGWNLIQSGLEGIQEISKMILTERFTCKNTTRLLHPNYTSIFVTSQEVLSQWFYWIREQKHDVKAMTILNFFYSNFPQCH